MSDNPDGQVPASTPPGEPTRPVEQTTPSAPADAAAPVVPATTDTAAPAAPPQHSGITKAALIWTGVIVVLLSFVASFLGASLARSADNAEPVETATPTASATQPTSEDYAEAIEEILPAGSAVRAGTGVPEAGKGYQGDVYIDVTTSDVYVFLDDEWVFAGNIRQSAAENLTGETGAAGADGATGATGATGETGAPGAPGTQILLGSGTPDNETCTADGDIYIDTDTDNKAYQ